MSFTTFPAPHPAASATPLLRRAAAADAIALSTFLQGLSPHSRRLRFHGACAAASPSLARRLCDVDGVHHQAWLAWAGSGGAAMVVGEARFVVSAGGRSAELAIVVADAWQGRGVAAALMGTLLDAARDAGVAELHGDVLDDNLRMQAFMQRHGFEADLFDRGDTLRMRHDLNTRPTRTAAGGLLAGLAAWLCSAPQLRHRRPRAAPAWAAR